LRDAGFHARFTDDARDSFREVLHLAVLGGAKLDFFLVNHGDFLAHVVEAGEKGSCTGHVSAKHFQDEHEDEKEE
jgi:hypothetical protein